MVSFSGAPAANRQGSTQSAGWLTLAPLRRTKPGESGPRPGHCSRYPPLKPIFPTVNITFTHVQSTHGGKPKLKGRFELKLTSYEKTKTTQQQTPQHDTHLSPVSWPCRRSLLSALFPSLRPLPRAKKRGFKNNSVVVIQLQSVLNDPRFHPGWLAAC